MSSKTCATCVVALLALFLASASPLHATEQASGRFESRHGWLDVAGAYAFPAPVGVSDEPGIRVAISNAGFRPEGVNLYWNRSRAITRFFQDDETLVVFFHFKPDGTLLGTSWYWGSGAGCGFCSNSAATSTVTVKNGRLAGRVALKTDDDDIAYDITLDVPVAPPTPGAEVAADGEAAKAYLAYHAALDARDTAAVAAVATADIRDAIANAKESGEDYLAVLGEDHPDTVRVVRAFESGDDAVLLVVGEVSWGTLHGEVQMRRENGSWRYWDELFDVGDWPTGLKP